MADSNETNRAALAKIAGLVRPALASQPYIPALVHILFDGKRATAYNDISAISVRCTLALQRCLPGEMFIKALGSFSGESVLIQEGKDGAVAVSSGRSKVKLPTLAGDQFPLELPGGDAPSIKLDGEIMRGIGRCLLAVGSDGTKPAQMGVTLDADDAGNAVLYSTDNYTISRFQTKSKVKLPGDAPVILPTFFCEQLGRLASAYPAAKDSTVLFLYAGALLAEVGDDAVLFSKTLVEVEPMNFPATFGKFCPQEALGAALTEIPPGFDEALGRALMVVAGDPAPTTLITIGEGTFGMHSETALGDADDRLKFDSKSDADAPFRADPGHLARGAKACTRMAFMPRCVAMADEKGEFVHLIAHVAAPK